MKTQTLDQIENLTRNFAEHYRTCESLFEAKRRELEALDKKYELSITRETGHLRAQFKALFTAIQSSPELFESPRTHVFHGFKVGFQRSKGSLSWKDEAAVLEKIHDRFGKDSIAYIATTEKPDKKFLSILPQETLAELGITLEEDGDKVMIKDMATTDKAISNALKSALQEVAV